MQYMILIYGDEQAYAAVPMEGRGLVAKLTPAAGVIPSGVESYKIYVREGRGFGAFPTPGAPAAGFITS